MRKPNVAKEPNPCSSSLSPLGQTWAVAVDVYGLLPGQEQAVFADAGYTGAPERCTVVEAMQSGEIRTDINWQVAQRQIAI